MTFRTIRTHVVVLRQIAVGSWPRHIGLGVLISSVLGFSVLAQSTSDFIDPLNDERVRIEKKVDAPQPPAVERPEPTRADPAEETTSANLLARARQGANAGAEAAQERATGFWAGMKASVADLAARMGMPTAGLLGLLGLALAALALLVGWTLFRGKGRRRGFETDDDVYARSSRDISARRQPGDSRASSPQSETAPAAFQETMPDDFDSIFAEEAEETGFDDDRTRPVAASASAAVDSSDASTWRKPNLDRLRDSIKADWKADKDRDDETTVANSAPAKTAPTPPTAPGSDPGELRLTEVSDGWEDWDEQADPEDDPWAKDPARDEPVREADSSATNRIRALRESLRAS